MGTSLGQGDAVATIARATAVVVGVVCGIALLAGSSTSPAGSGTEFSRDLAVALLGLVAGITLVGRGGQIAISAGIGAAGLAAAIGASHVLGGGGSGSVFGDAPMSPYTGLAVVALALSVSTLRLRGGLKGQLSGWMALVSAAIGLAAMNGYFNAAPVGEGWATLASVDLPAAISLFLLGGVLISLRADTGMGRILTSGGSGGYAFRSLLALALGLPLVLSWLRAEFMGGADPAVSVWVVIGFAIAGLLAVAWSLGRQLDIADERNRAAERVVSEADKKLKAVSDNAADALVGGDEYGRITFFNVAAERLFGYRAEQMLGRPANSLFPERDWPEFEGATAPAAPDEQDRDPRRTIEIRGMRSDGREFPIEASFSCWEEGLGEGRQFVAVIRDVTERREEQLAIEKLAAIFDGAGDGILACDLRGRITEANPAAEEIFGYRASRLVGMEISELVTASAAGKLRRNFAALDPDRLSTFEIPIERSDGQIRQITVSPSAIKGRDGKVIAWAGVLRDDTEAMRHYLDRERLASIVDHTGDAVLLLGTDMRVLEANGAAEEMFGYSADQFRNLDVSAMLVSEEARSQMEEVEEILRCGGGQIETRRVRSDGRVLDVALTLSPIREEAGRLAAISVIARDIGERKELERKLELMAHHDELTGLPNRRRFMEELEAFEARSSRYRNAGALLAIDLDRFKRVNDTYGHAAGDDFIVDVAGVLRATLRDSDFIARLGGDEFAVILPESGEQEAYEAGKRCVEAVSNAPCGREGEPASISVGATAFVPGVPAARLMRRADSALYEAKAAGGGTVGVYTADTDPDITAFQRTRRRFQQRQNGPEEAGTAVAPGSDELEA